MKLPAHKLLYDANQDQSHWGIRIINAEIRGYFKVTDDEDSSQWLSCACGKLDDHIKVHGESSTISSALHNSPVDNLLYTLGIRFSNYVDAFTTVTYIYNDLTHTEITSIFYSAAETLIAIEARSLELYMESLR
jgi:hypothetical protein